MSKIFEVLEKYFDNTPRDQLARDLESLEYLNDIGPDVLEYTRSVKTLIKNEKNS